MGNLYYIKGVLLLYNIGFLTHPWSNGVLKKKAAAIKEAVRKLRCADRESAYLHWEK
jgi:hypothetical protein